MADELVNVDLSAEDLRERLASGRVYTKPLIEEAMTNFFKIANLTRLRELTLGEVAHLLDRRREPGNQEIRGAAERIMVCIHSRSPNPAALLRKGARLSSRLNTSWYAVYFQTPLEERKERKDPASQRQIKDSLILAKELGAIPLRLNSTRVIDSLADFVKEHEITHILIGRTQRPWYRRFFAPSLLERLLERVRGIDVIIVENE